MPDLLVNLLELDPLEPELAELAQQQIIIRRAQPFELTKVCSFIEDTFSLSWADEISVGLGHQPVSVYIATMDREVVGFAGYECTRRSFFGPMGVSPAMQGKGVGRVLVLACMWGLREMGYVYGIIGHAGPVEFYEKAVGAMVIPDSDPSIYVDLLK
ncbi:MAG TPA: GNAT family N-acetyltransferase [Pyrinomonadaceae bacterium]|nr:GNAT family N-acetyltransferase [Pyrinomonadaceae bacterium]